MIAIATRLEPTMRPSDAMTKELVIVDVPLVVSNVTNAWISISNFLIVKTTVSLSIARLGTTISVLFFRLCLQS